MSVRSDRLMVTAAAAAAAFFLVHGTAHRDLLMGHATSIRIADGQLPYHDFFPHVLPLAAALSAPLFSALPTPGIAVLVQAIALNAVMALLVYQLLINLLHERLPAMAGALVSAAWYCQIGGYHHDQVAYLLPFAAYVHYDATNRGRAPGALEGILLGCAPFAKQSVGSFAALAFLAVILLFGGWRQVLRPRFLAGLAVPFAVAGIYVTALDAWPAFTRYAVAMQLEYGHHQTSLSRLLLDFVEPWGVDPVAIVGGRHLGQMAFYPIVLSIYFSYVVIGVAFWHRRIPRHLLQAYVFLLLSTVWSAATPQRLYTHVTLGFPAIAALTIHVWLDYSGRRPVAAVRRFVWTGTVLLCCSIAALLAYGELYREDRRESPLARERLWPLTFDQEHRATIEVALPLLADASSYALFGDFLNAIPLAAGRAPSDPIVTYAFWNTIPVDPQRRREWEHMFISRMEAVAPELLVTRLEGSTDGAIESSLEPPLSYVSFPAVGEYVERAFPRMVRAEGSLQIRAR